MAGAIANEMRQRRFFAAMFANLVNCWSKKRVTVDQLLGIQKHDFASMTDREKAEAIAAVQKKREAWRAKLAESKPAKGKAAKSKS